MRVLGIIGLLALALIAGGCGDSKPPAAAPEDAADKQADAKLLSLVSAAIDRERTSAGDIVDYADFALARQQLDLSADEDIYKDSPSPLSPLLGALIYASRPDKPPLVSAIDGGSIQAVASRPIVFGEPALVAIRTTQAFSDIAAALSRDGYVQRGDLLVSPRSMSDVAFPVVADAGGGVLVLGGSANFVRGVLATRNPPLSRAAELIDAVPGPARVAQTTTSTCVIAGAAGQNLSPRDGEYLLQVKETASEEKLKLPDGAMPTATGEIVFGDVAANGDEVRVEFTYTERLNAVISMLPIDGSAYDC